MFLQESDPCQQLDEEQDANLNLSENTLNQFLVMLKNTKIKSPEEFALNRGIEIMLPRRRIVKPSWIDRTFRLLDRWVRIRIDIRKEELNGN